MQPRVRSRNPNDSGLFSGVTTTPACRSLSTALAGRQGVIKEQFVEHKKLEKTAAKLTGDIQALEVR